jgi:hypothetical protein
MQVLLSTEEITKVLHTCFCDGGLELLGYCGIKLDYSEEDYKAARKALENPCVEDIYIQMLKEKRKVCVIDTENGNEETELTLEKATENFKNPEVAEDLVLLVTEGDYDAIPCYRLLQHALYGKVIYG